MKEAIRPANKTAPEVSVELHVNWKAIHVVLIHLTTQQLCTPWLCNNWQAISPPEKSYSLANQLNQICLLCRPDQKQADNMKNWERTEENSTTLINWSFALDNFATDYRKAVYYWAQTTHFNYLKCCIKLKCEGDRILSKVCCDRTRGNGFKLKEERFRLHVRKKDFFFMIRVVKHRHRLPREVVGAPSLEMLKVRLDRALHTLIQLYVSLFTAGELDQMAFKGPNSNDSTILRWTELNYEL